MTSIRKVLYAGLLALTVLTVLPSPASAQESAHGEFTLPHDVHWKNALVPAGTYQFSLASNGASGMLTLLKVDHARAGFMMLVNDISDLQGTGTNQLVIETYPSGSYVHALRLPKIGLTLQFPVPVADAERQIATGVTAPVLSGQ